MLERAPTASPSLRAGALVTLGSLFQGGDKAESARYQSAALGLYLRAGDALGAAAAQIFLAYQHWRSGHVEAFRAEAENARILAESSGNIRAMIHFHWLSAEADCDSGDLDGCMAQFEAWQQQHVVAGERPPAGDGVRMSRRMMGAALYSAGRPSDARVALAELVAEFRARDSVEAGVWADAGRACLALGQIVDAAVFFREGLDAAVSDDIQDLTIWNLEGLASVAHGRGQFHAAALLFGAASAMRETFHCSLEPAEAPRREREMTTIRAALGDAGAEAILAEGRSLGKRETLALARQQDVGDD